MQQHIVAFTQSLICYLLKKKKKHLMTDKVREKDISHISATVFL